MGGATPIVPGADEVPGHKKNRFGQMQARMVSVDNSRLHIILRKPKGAPVEATKAYDTISQLLQVSSGNKSTLQVMCRDIAADKPKSLTIQFATAGDSNLVRSVCERAIGTRETKPLKQYEDEYKQESVPIGTGHFAKVYLTRHKASGLTCAAKVVDKTKLSRTEAKNLLGEIAIMRMLKHPHVVSLYNVYEDERNLVLCEELCAGGELFDRIVHRKKYSERMAREVCKVILETMVHYHSRGVVHLDLKPENLLLVDTENDLNVKITDWGLAQIIANNEVLHRQCGTPGYTAPEVLAGEKLNPRGYDMQADVWSLGVITYILLCGYPPFDLLPNATFHDEYRLVTSAPPVFEPEDWTAVSREARDFVLRMLVVDPGKRWTAKKLLSHSWMTASDVRDDHMLRAAKKFKRYNAARHLRSVVRTLIVINRMTKRLGLPKDKNLGLKPSTLKPGRLDAAGVNFRR
mmetsp:Transcript_10690/g.27777  ORF Transcript_10690/g.27777 Transcript_10690/m.27777 type:complete len:462 (-) Transcript_10690:305-1690(-)